MKTTIHKFELTVGDNEIRVPSNSTILSVQNQKGKIILWVLVDLSPTALLNSNSRHFYVVGTGHTINEERDLHFVDTVQLTDGLFVLHVFEECNPCS